MELRCWSFTALSCVTVLAYWLWWRAGMRRTARANDPVVSLASEVVSWVPLLRARQLNALWYRQNESWCAVTRIDETMDVTPRCERSH